MSLISVPSCSRPGLSGTFAIGLALTFVAGCGAPEPAPQDPPAATMPAATPAPTAEASSGTAENAAEAPGDPSPTDNPTDASAGGTPDAGQPSDEDPGTQVAAPLDTPPPPGASEVGALLQAYDTNPPTVDDMTKAAGGADLEQALVFLSRSDALGPAVKQRATSSLGMAPGAAARGRIIEIILNEEEDPNLRRAACQAVTAFTEPDNQILEVLGSVLRDPNPAVARAAVFAAAQFPELRNKLDKLRDGAAPQVVSALDEVLKGGK